MSSKNIYKIIFHHQDKIYEVYAHQMCQSAMLGFIEIEGLIFGERSTVLVDPSEEKIKLEFDGVHRTYIPLHSIVRIDEVEKEGENRIYDTTSQSGSVTPFPTTTPPRKDT